jgi:hypothetical protein
MTDDVEELLGSMEDDVVLIQVLTEMLRLKYIIQCVY